MRARAIVVVMVAAIGLGLLTGRFVLPARSAPAAPRATPGTATTPPATPGATTAPTGTPGSAASSTATPGTAASSTGGGSAAPKPANGPMAYQHLLAAAEFRKVGFTRRIYVRDRVGDGRYANAACAGEKTLGETLGGPDAHFRGWVTTTKTDGSDPTLAVDIGDQVAREVAGDAGSPALARNFAQRLLLEEVPCQQEPAGHWVYGPTRTIDVAPGITASWMGSYDGDLNTTGTAPRGKEPCGGVAILQNGSHYGVLEVDACLGTAAMTRIVRAAVTRL